MAKPPRHPEDAVETDLVTHDLAAFGRLPRRPNGCVPERLPSHLMVAPHPCTPIRSRRPF
ncbi:hypothetical protein [Streptomyces sp. NBC_01803]|uniref:hypothetical protein n=1 Tax=Streptomyces sp. NBC_01803 TaxID=2975946 RepID=UPI002DD8600A|nr:hypothetical protein [Streptomyces sp. NBC_01803]WSA45057.1 hypothetical protein OIE51_13065 [Streptomyces sp. NBC_01803]